MKEARIPVPLISPGLEYLMVCYGDWVETPHSCLGNDRMTKP